MYPSKTAANLLRRMRRSGLLKKGYEKLSISSSSACEDYVKENDQERRMFSKGYSYQKLSDRPDSSVSDEENVQECGIGAKEHSDEVRMMFT